jgi:hypothetical protein
VRVFGCAVLVGMGLAAGLAGCSAGPVADSLPPSLGLPAGAPERPTTAYQYPAVHDMPPPRTTQPMSEEQQQKLENELATVRDRQEGRQAPKKPGQITKKKAAPANNAQNGGVKANP